MNALIVAPICAALLVAALFTGNVFRSGSREISNLETIQGIPYPTLSEGIEITESLAHADIYLREPVFAKALTLTLRFHPGNAENIRLGVRENSFWLSYPWVSVWESNQPRDWQEKSITIPLTDKLQETDRSIDIMFFSESDETTDIESTEIHDIQWQVADIQAVVTPYMPTSAHIKDYVRSVIKQERAL